MKLLVAGALAGIAASNLAQVSARCGANVPLCETEPIELEPEHCLNQDLQYDFESCCVGDSVNQNECPADPVPTVRIAEMRTPFASNGDDCCAKIELDLTWTLSPESCCKQCSCFGDPHCISFNGTEDTWILCDGRAARRQATPGLELTCPIQADVCTKELDHMGRPCVMVRNDNKPNDNGSPCRSGSEEAAELVMYRFPGFDTALGVGERGVINDIRITSDGNLYYLAAEDCFGESMPWRDQIGAKNPPTDPNWLPYSWQSERFPLKRTWFINGLPSGIEIRLTCVKNSKTARARLDIDALLEPVNNRKLASGVCVDGKIDKLLSTERPTDVRNFCRASQSQSTAMIYFCGKQGLETPSQCRNSFCSRMSSTNKETDTCLSKLREITDDLESGDGWEKLWCARNVLGVFNRDECTTRLCRQCVFDIQDFGWEVGVPKWGNYYKSNGGGGSGGGSGSLPCIPIKDLNTTLDKCQNGVTVQYLATDAVDEDNQKTTCWTDLFSVPEGRAICEGKVIISPFPLIGGGNFPMPAGVNLVENVMRVVQINNDAMCPDKPPQDECSPGYGLRGSITLVPYEISTEAQLYWQLIREGKLICPPNNPSCLTNIYGNQLPVAQCTGCEWCPAR